jgi:nicotinate-nucleotide pyrophosphorylase (carboxylating)
VRAAREHAHHLLRIEVEVEDAAQAAEAISAGADVLLLDNMTDAQMAAIISRHSGQCLFEASGNLTAERLAAFPGIGVQVASMGGLIHQSRWADLSMKFDAEPAR